MTVIRGRRQVGKMAASMNALAKHCCTLIAWTCPQRQQQRPTSGFTVRWPPTHKRTSPEVCIAHPVFSLRIMYDSVRPSRHLPHSQPVSKRLRYAFQCSWDLRVTAWMYFAPVFFFSSRCFTSTETVWLIRDRGRKRHWEWAQAHLPVHTAHELWFAPARFNPYFVHDASFLRVQRYSNSRCSLSDLAGSYDELHVTKPLPPPTPRPR